MKICPRCQKTYSDDNLNFCLEDGSALSVASAPLMPETVVMNEPRITQPQPPPSVPGSQPGWQQPPPQQQYSMQPAKKKSKAWIWVLLILGVLVVLCGGGGILGYFAYKSAENEVLSTLANANISFSSSPTPSGTKGSTTTTTSTSGRSNLTDVELKMFVQKFSIYGTTEMNGDELTMGSISKDFYYVLVAPDKDVDEEPIDKYVTDDADVRVTVRNFANAESRFGYGLVFHSNPQPLQQGYAFLIDTKRKKYRVVHHEPQDEKTVVKWTASTAIREGSEENTLEMRDTPDKIELYINGTMVTSITNVYGYPGGVVGLYSGDGVKIAFKDLEIRR